MSSDSTEGPDYEGFNKILIVKRCFWRAYLKLLQELGHDNLEILQTPRLLDLYGTWAREVHLLHSLCGLLPQDEHEETRNLLGDIISVVDECAAYIPIPCLDNE